MMLPTNGGGEGVDCREEPRIMERKVHRFGLAMSPAVEVEETVLEKSAAAVAALFGKDVASGVVRPVVWVVF